MKNPATQSSKCAIYLRISLDRNMDGLAIQRQREDCLALAQYRGWEVVETFVDQSVSATDKAKKRPAYEQMIVAYEAGAFEAIVCYDLDRLTRQPRELEDWIDRAESKGLKLVTANGDADLSTDGGRMYARIKAAVARSEVERKGARQSRAHEQRAQQGRPPKGVAPFGYNVNSEIVEKESTAVKSIYCSFLKGYSLRRIARALDGDELIEEIEPISSRSGRKWNPASILQMLRNPRYAGYSVYTAKEDRQQPAGKSRRLALRDNIVRNEDGNPIKGQWEPIIDAGIWWNVQAILDSPDRVTNKSKSTKRKYMGAGLYECGECGRKVITRARYYSCPDGCLNRSREMIDEFVEKVIAKRLSMKDATRRKRVIASPTEELEAAIKRQDERIARAEHDYDLELIEAVDLKRIREAARVAIQDAKAAHVAAGAETALQPILKTADPAQAFCKADVEVRRAVVDVLATVTLLKGQQGKKGFQPESVRVGWK